MLNKLLATENEYGALIVRVALGVVMFPHGAQKMLGWFGGNGFSGTMHHFTENMGIPYLLALLVILAEFFGAIGLVVGALTRIAAFGIGCVMIGAIVTVHWQYGFFMNWFGNQAGEGFEYHILAIGMCLALMLRGAGAFSVDRWLAEKMGGGHSPHSI